MFISLSHAFWKILPAALRLDHILPSSPTSINRWLFVVKKLSDSRVDVTRACFCLVTKLKGCRNVNERRFVSEISLMVVLY